MTLDDWLNLLSNNIKSHLINDDDWKAFSDWLEDNEHPYNYIAKLKLYDLIKIEIYPQYNSTTYTYDNVYFFIFSDDFYLSSFLKTAIRLNQDKKVRFGKISNCYYLSINDIKFLKNVFDIIIKAVELFNSLNSIVLRNCR